MLRSGGQNYGLQALLDAFLTLATRAMKAAPHMRVETTDILPYSCSDIFIPLILTHVKGVSVKLYV